MYKASLIVPLPEAVDKGEGYWVFAIFYSAHREYNSRGDGHWFASLVAQTVKNLPAVQEMWVQKAMAAHSSVLAWRIPGTGAPGGLPSVGSHRVGHDWSDLAAAAVPNTILRVYIFSHLIFRIPWGRQEDSFLQVEKLIWRSSPK